MEIQSVYDSIHMIQEISFEIIKKTILFVMRDNIKPMWEDESNRDGGGFSLKIDINLIVGQSYKNDSANESSTETV